MSGAIGLLTMLVYEPGQASLRIAGGDQRVEFVFESPKDFVIRKGSERLCAAFEVDEVGAAPQSEIGVVGFPGTIHAAAHHRDCDLVVPRVGRHFLHLLREFNEGLIFHS